VLQDRSSLTALWGIDFLLLGKDEEKWMICHVLWLSTPAN
jgi:hypothetical protein